MAATSVSVHLNGKPEQLPGGTTVADLVARLALGSGRFAVEVNEQIVPRSTLGAHMLKSGDKVEIIGFVGGG
jgi:sulfur carrier protein